VHIVSPACRGSLCRAYGVNSLSLSLFLGQKTTPNLTTVDPWLTEFRVKGTHISDRTSG
jgi:hypothetical protein